MSAGPFKQLVEASLELNLSVEADDRRRPAFKRTSTSVKAVAERIRADRHAAASLAATGTLGFAGSIGAFSSQGSSLSAKVSASQYALGSYFSRTVFACHEADNTTLYDCQLHVLVEACSRTGVACDHLRVGF